MTEKDRLKLRVIDGDTCGKCPFRNARRLSCELYHEELEQPYYNPDFKIFYRCEQCVNNMVVNPQGEVNKLLRDLKKDLKEMKEMSKDIKLIKQHLRIR